MNRETIISLGVTPVIARAIADYLKTNMPIPLRFPDPTAIVNNEGMMVGWQKAAIFLEQLSLPLSEQPTEEIGMYTEPPKR